MAEKLSVLGRLGSAFNRRNFPSFCFKATSSEVVMQTRDVVSNSPRAEESYLTVLPNPPRV